MELFDREVYGRVPKNVPKVRWEVTGTTRETESATPVVTKALLGHVDNSSYSHVKVAIELTLSTPAGPNWPAFLTFASRYLGPRQETG